MRDAGSPGRKESAWQTRTTQGASRRLQAPDSRPLQRWQACRRDHGRLRPRPLDRAAVDQLHQRDRIAEGGRQQDPGAAAHSRPREGEQAPAHGERRFKTSCADIRTKLTVIAVNAGRYPVSAQCEILGVPRSACCAMRGRAEPAEALDPAAEEVARAFEESRGRYGAGEIEASLARRGIVLSRCRIGRIMKGKGLVSAYANAKFMPSRSSVGEADAPHIVYGGAVPDATRAPGEAERLRQLAQQLQAPPDARLHEPGRVQIGGTGSQRKVPKKVLPIHRE